MARYTGPVCRLCRRAGGKLFIKGDRCFTPNCSVDKRPKPPGQQLSRRRPKFSDRALQLREKQKARHSYGILERQFRGIFAEAERQAGIGTTNYSHRVDRYILRSGAVPSRGGLCGEPWSYSRARFHLNDILSRFSFRIIMILSFINFVSAAR